MPNSAAAAVCRCHWRPRSPPPPAGTAPAIGVIVDDPGRHAMFVGGDLAHPAAGPQLHPGAKRLRPIGDVGARLRPLRASRRAMAEIDALRAAVVFGGGDRDVRRPPVPAQPVHRPRITGAGPTQRNRRQGRRMRRHGRIAGQPRRRSCDRSRQNTARASNSRSANRRPRHQATSRGSRRDASAGNVPSEGRCRRQRR